MSEKEKKVDLRLVFLGPPGAGKGTQAVRLARWLKIPHISTGDIFRKNIKEETDLGKRIKDYLNSGDLVPDVVVVEIVNERLGESDAVNGYLLDGFPRTQSQAQALEEKGKDINTVFYFDTSETVVVDRLSGRRLCEKCGANYHIRYMPPRQENKCDRCSGELWENGFYVR